MIKVLMGRANTLKLAATVMVLLVLFAGGCSFGDSEKKEKYVNKINELTKQDDKEVEDYNDSVVKYGTGQITAENMAILADKRRE